MHGLMFVLKGSIRSGHWSGDRYDCVTHQSNDGCDMGGCDFAHID